jgi:hypothetical protein
MASQGSPIDHASLAPYRVDTCPECKHALQGLPEAHGCTVCATVYGTNSLCFPMAHFKWTYYVVLFLLGVPVAAMALRHGSLLVLPTPCFLIAFVPGLLIALGSLVNEIRRRRQPEYLFIGEGGIAWRLRSSVDVRWSWKDVADVRFHPENAGKILIKPREGAAVYVPGLFFPKGVPSQALADAIAAFRGN